MFNRPLTDPEYELIATSYNARSFRLAVVQQEYDAGNLTEAEARELLAGPLTPDDPSTIADDSDQLKVKP